MLGTPCAMQVAASVLRHIIYEVQEEDATFELVGVVSQPGKPKGRGNKATPVPSPVEETARAWKRMPKDGVLTPASAKDPAFLDQVRAMKPDLCVTAAYGNILPQAFLDIPALGTLNIHPSLLPK
jgi:methionyl-tRNA formyltransferase